MLMRVGEAGPLYEDLASPEQSDIA